MRDSFRFALDAVLDNRRRMLLTVAIIAVGVASLVGIQTAVSILADEVAGSLGRAGAGLFTLQAKEGAPPISYRQAVAFRDMPGRASRVGLVEKPRFFWAERPRWPKKVLASRWGEALPGISASVWAVSKTQVQVRSNGMVTDPVVRVVACDENYVACQDVRLAAGRGFTIREVQERQPVVVLGDNVRKKLFGGGNGLGEKVAIGSGRYQVIGVLGRQGALYGSSLDASLLVPIDGSATNCCITLRGPDGVAASAVMATAGQQMAAIRRLQPGTEPDFEIVQADRAEEMLASIRSKLSLVALAIGLVTMLGASVGLMNSMLVSVKQRTREIGTRRALGAPARIIAQQYLLESVLIGQMGNVAGVLLGLLFGGMTALILDGHFSVPWPWVGAATVLSVVVSLASGLLPARRAAALDPVEALRSL